MRLLQTKSIFPLIAILTFGLANAAAQTQDSSQDSLLKGAYDFRHVAVQNVDTSYNPTEVTAIYGIITFDGAGNYTIAGTRIDNTVSSGASQALNVTGTYAIGAGGSGYITNPVYPTDSSAVIYGAVAQGVFTGSSTESEFDFNIFNDIFVAIPAAASAPTNASFTSSYQTGLLDFTNGGSTAIYNALFELSPNGQGKFGTITLNGQASNQSSGSVVQTVAGASYNFNSDKSATLTIPLPNGVSSGAMFTGSRTMFESADGNFILGWTAGGYDIFFGVKALAVPGTNSLSTGLYYTAGLEDSPSVFGTDSFYGSIANSGDAAGDGIVHERLNLPDEYSFDFGLDNQLDLNSNGSTSVDLNGYTYLFGDGGNAFVGIGTVGNFSLIIGMHAPSFTGPGVYLNPVGVVNAASWQPVTASLAPGELIVLFGSGLAPSAVVTQGGAAFPTNVNGVTATIDSIPCAIYYVSPTQISLIVPYGVAANQTGLANIQVTNNGVASNVIQTYLTDAAPGSFSQNANGIGLAAALHAATGALITPTNPAQPGEFVSLYMTGLGTVSPTVADGSIGSSTTLSWADIFNAGNLTVDFNDFDAGATGIAGTVQYAGLVPTLAGLYQINVQVPNISGYESGDAIYVEFVTDAADNDQIQLAFGSPSSSRAVHASVRRNSKAARIAQIRSKSKRPAPRQVRRGVVLKTAGS